MSSDWIGTLLIGAALASPLPAQEQGPPGSAIISSDISISREAATLRLELDNGAELAITLDESGAVRMNGDRIGSYERRDALDASWRELLQQAMDAPTGTLADLLTAWEPPSPTGDAGRRVDRALEAAVRPAGESTAQLAPGDVSDSIQRLNARIRELEQLVQDPGLAPEVAADLPALRELVERDLREQIRREVRSELRSDFRRDARRSRGWEPVRYITRGIASIFSTLMVYAILIGLGFLAVFFGRRHVEAVADTARQATLRSALVGLAGGFLVIPTFVLGTLALVISIVGIPLLIVWAPGFWLAAAVAALGGFLAVAHGAGEAFAERRFSGTEWFTRANSYYYIMAGVGLLMVLFVAANIVGMAGPWLDFMKGLLLFVGWAVVGIAFVIGFGAFLISRAGTRPPAGRAGAPEPDLAEEPHV